MKIVMSFLIIVVLSLSLCACGSSSDAFVEGETYQENTLTVSGLVTSMILSNNQIVLTVKTSDNGDMDFIMSNSMHIYDETYSNKDTQLSEGCHVKIEYFEKEQNYNRIKIQKITLTSYDGSFNV